MRVSVVIPHLEGVDILEKCLSTLQLSASLGEIIVFDNGSTDGSIDMVESRFPGVKVLRSQKNYGFAGACNRGASQCSEDVIFFVNDDAWLENDTIRFLLQEIEDGADLVQPRILNPDGTLQAGALSVDWLGHPGPARSDDPFYASGTALMVRRSVFEALSGFDEDYFAFWEDTDLSWRSWLSGYRVVYCDKATVFHSGGQTIGATGMVSHNTYRTNYRRMYFGRRNCLVTLIKNYRFRTLMLILPLWAFESIAEIGMGVVTGNFLILKVYASALGWIIRHRRDIKDKRIAVQDNRSRGDLALMKYMLPPGQRLRIGLRLLFSGRAMLSE